MSKPVLLLLLAISGGLGTLARYGAYVAVNRLHPDPPPNVAPIATLLVNALGCFLFGLIWEYAASSHNISRETRLLLLTGFLGAFTTFSTFGFETQHLLRHGAYFSVITTVVLQNVLGITLAAVGVYLGHRLAG